MMNLKQLLCSVLIGSCLFTSGCSLIPMDGTITYGLYYEDQDISGYSRDAVSSLIHTEASNNKTITITIPNQGTRQVKVKDLGITLDTASTESNIFTYGYEDDLKMLIMHRITAFIYKVHINPVYKLDEVTAKAYFTELAKQIDVSGHDALLTVENGQVKMTPSKEGKRVDIDETIKQLKAQLEENNFNNISIEFTSKDTVRVTNDDVKPLTAVLGSYTTNFDTSNTNRTHNIELASPVIIDGKLVPGIGGGICQVSSTLFNTALLSGMNIIERTPHFEPVSYIPAGRDATVAYGYLDFQFKNPYAHNIYVLSVMNNGQLTIYIIGVPEDVPKSVSISVGDRTDIPNQTITKIDPSAKEDSTEEGHIGFRINTYRTITYGNWVTTTDVFESTYDPVDTIITKKPAAPEPAKKDSPKSKTKR